MMKAIWNGEVLAESDETTVLEGNHYFPPESIKDRFFTNSEHQTRCFWKGRASYFHVRVGGEVNENAAWYYPEPKRGARKIQGYVAFWRGVEVRQ